MIFESEVIKMWIDDIEDEEYERLNLDYEYPEYGNAYDTEKKYLTRNKHTERYIDSYYDSLKSDSYND